jgi:hypothetical protein
MPRGKKECPQCGTMNGVRAKLCKCGYEFVIKNKQGKSSAHHKVGHPLGHEFVPVPGLWVFDVPKGMPKIRVPEPLSNGPQSNKDITEYISYNGLGDCIYSLIGPRKIADPKLRKKWQKARDAMKEVWVYLTGETDGGMAHEDTA